MICVECSKEFKPWVPATQKFCSKHCSNKNHKRRMGELNPATHSEGFKLSLASAKKRRVVPTGYIALVFEGWNEVLEHRMIMAQHLQRPLQAGETIHHRNGKREDNRIDNLELRMGAHGSGATECPSCGFVFGEARQQAGLDTYGRKSSL